MQASSNRFAIISVAGALSCLVCLVPGCGAPRVVLPETLVAAGKQDKIAAIHAYKGEKIQLKAAVLNKDVYRGQTTSYEGGVWGAYMFMSPETTTYSVPYLVLEPGIFCFFGEDAIEDLAPVQKGETVGVTGVVDDFVKNSNGFISPLVYECELTCRDGCKDGG